MKDNHTLNAARKNSLKNMLIIGVALLILFVLYSTIKSLELIAFILFLVIIAYIIIC
jgi:uncharacterized membrane protein YfhO